MTCIVLDDDQARIVAGAHEAVEVRDRQGKALGIITPRPTASSRGVTDEEIGEALRGLCSKEPRYTTAEVLEHLSSLEAR